MKRYRIGPVGELGQATTWLKGRRRLLARLRAADGPWRWKRRGDARWKGTGLSSRKATSQVMRVARRAKPGVLILLESERRAADAFAVRIVEVAPAIRPPDFASPPIRKVWLFTFSKWPRLESWGIYSPRPVVGGSAPSQHNDFGAPVGGPNAVDLHGPADVMRELADALRRNARELNVYRIIYDHRQSVRGGGWEAYGGENPHTDHVHVDGDPQGTLDTCRSCGWAR